MPLKYIHISQDPDTITWSQTIITCLGVVVVVVVVVLVAQSCLTLCDLMDCSPPGFPVHGIFQAGILEWAAMSFSRGSSQPRDQAHISCTSCTGRWILYHCATWEAPHVCCWWVTMNNSCLGAHESKELLMYCLKVTLWAASLNPDISVEIVFWKCLVGGYCHSL